MEASFACCQEDLRGVEWLGLRAFVAAAAALCFMAMSCCAPLGLPFIGGRAGRLADQWLFGGVCRFLGRSMTCTVFASSILRSLDARCWALLQRGGKCSQCLARAIYMDYRA